MSVRCVLVRRVLWLAVVLGLIAVGANAASPPDFKLKTADGDWFTLKDHLGDKVIYLSFWATWCNPCRREMPHLEKMYQELGDRGFLVVSVNTDPPANTSKIKPFLNRMKLSYPCLLDPDNTVHDKYNPTRELPYAVLIDRSGNIHQRFAGYRAGDEELLREEVLKLLAVDAPGASASGASANE